MPRTQLKCLPLLLAAALAPTLGAQRMLMVGIAGEVSELELATAVLTPVGTMADLVGLADDSVPAGLTYDFVNGHLYAASSVEDQVFVVDPTDWRARSLGRLGLGQSFRVTGLVWDPLTATLFGVGSNGGAGTLFRVNPATGRASVVGPTGLTGRQCLASDLTTGDLLLFDTTTDALYSVDRTTGTIASVGGLAGPQFVVGAAHNLTNLTCYAIDRRPFNAYALLTVDTATGAATQVGLAGNGTSADIAYIPGTGRLLRQPHGCGPASIFVTGSPNLGGSIKLLIENPAGVAFLGFDTAALSAPYCGCTIGHGWTVASPGASATLTMPTAGSLLGANVFAQGLNLGGVGGCASPVLTLTDTIEIQIGN